MIAATAAVCLQWPLRPKKQETEKTFQHVWKVTLSDGGPYYVRRVQPKIAGYAPYFTAYLADDPVEPHPDRPDLSRTYGTLEQAFLACERQLQQREGVPVDSNASAAMSAFRARSGRTMKKQKSSGSFASGGYSKGTQTKRRPEETMILSRSEAVSLLQAAGCKAANTFPSERLARDLVALEGVSEDELSDLLSEDPENAELLSQVLAAARGGRGVEVAEESAGNDDAPNEPPAAPAPPQRNGHHKVKAALPVQQTEVTATGVRELSNPKWTRVSYKLAREWKEMERFPKDRGLKPSRLEMLRKAVLAGRFRGNEWADCHVMETGQIYRMNGNHTANVLFSLFEEGRKPETSVLVRHFECDTMEEAAGLWGTFDPKGSARTKGEVIRSYSSACPAFDGVRNELISLATAALAFVRWGKEAKRKDADEQAEELLARVDFVMWLDLFVDRPRKEVRHIWRTPVIAAMARCFEKDRESAELFWPKIRDDCDDLKNAPTRTLFRWLTTHNLGNKSSATDVVGEHHMYVVCIQAWNAWRAGDSTVRFSYRYGMDAPSAR